MSAAPAYLMHTSARQPDSFSRGLARGKAAQLFSPGHHASTFGGNPLACRVGCTVLDIMQRDHIPPAVTRRLNS